MSRVIIWLAVTSLVGIAAQIAGPGRGPIPGRLSEALEKIDIATADLTPAFVVAVTDRTRTLGVVAHGYADIKAKIPATRDSLFEIGSIGKSFTAIALMEMADEGRFDPQVPLATYLPWFRVHSSPGPITSHHVLTHTAGLPNYRADLASTLYAAYALREFDVPYAPGSHYWYSNTGFQTLGYLLERIDGAVYHSIIERRILNRIGMPSTVAVIDDALRTRLPVSYTPWPYSGEPVEQPWFEYRAGDGSIASTGADMAAYVRVILNRGALPGGRLLSERAFATLTTPLHEEYAYGLRVRQADGDTVIGHNGGIAGFSSVMEAHMNDGYGVVMLTNGRPSRELARWVLAVLKAAMRSQALPPPPPVRPAASTASAHEFAGVYRSPGGEALEFVDAGGMLSLSRGASTVPLTSLNGDAFVASAPDLAAVPFEFGRQNGRVVEVAHGADWYASGLYAGPRTFQVPSEYRAYVGRYENHNPERSVVRIVVRKSQLVALPDLDPSVTLVPLGRASFKPSTPDFNPERYRFDSIVDGATLRLSISGMPLYRIDDR